MIAAIVAHSLWQRCGPTTTRTAMSWSDRKATRSRKMTMGGDTRSRRRTGRTGHRREGEGNQIPLDSRAAGKHEQEDREPRLALPARHIPRHAYRRKTRGGTRHEAGVRQANRRPSAWSLPPNPPADSLLGWKARASSSSPAPASRSLTVPGSCLPAASIQPRRSQCVMKGRPTTASSPCRSASGPGGPTRSARRMP